MQPGRRLSDLETRQLIEVLDELALKTDAMLTLGTLRAEGVDIGEAAFTHWRGWFEDLAAAALDDDGVITMAGETIGRFTPGAGIELDPGAAGTVPSVWLAEALIRNYRDGLTAAALRS